MNFSPDEIEKIKETHALWNRIIFKVLSDHCDLNKVSAQLDSSQLHKLAAEFDPSRNQPWVNTAVQRANTYCIVCSKRIYAEGQAVELCHCK